MNDSGKRGLAVCCIMLQLAVLSVEGEGFFDAMVGTIKRIVVPPLADSSNNGKEDSLVNKNVICRFFDEDFTPGGFPYEYPENGSKVTIAEGIAKNGEVSLQFDLAADDYSGGAVCLYNMVYDLRPLIKKAALQFWIKGALGNESTMVSLVDEEKSDRSKTVVRLPVNWYGQITKEWSLISIPLDHFVRLNEKGVYWDKRRKEEIPDDFDWDKVAEFRIEVRKDENKSFRVWVDDIFIVGLQR